MSKRSHEYGVMVADAVSNPANRAALMMAILRIGLFISVLDWDVLMGLVVCGKTCFCCVARNA